MSAVAVTVTWAPEKQSRPSSGVYSTVARFGVDPNFEKGAWSITLRFDPPEAAIENPCTATAEFLNPDAAPSGWLIPGATFEMMEGRRVAAQVVVH